MTSETEPLITVTIEGDEPIRLILPGDEWTYEEAIVAQEISGMAPVEIEDRLAVADPRAGMAILRVSYMRAGRDFPQTGIARSNVMNIVQAIAEAAKRARAEVPPTSPTASENSELVAGSESDSSEGPSTVTT